jgi:hypothetical protein
MRWIGGTRTGFSTLFSVCNEGVERIGDEKGLDKILPLSGNRVNRAFSGAAMEVASPAPRITFLADSASNPIGIMCATPVASRGIIELWARSGGKTEFGYEVPIIAVNGCVVHLQ